MQRSRGRGGARLQGFRGSGGVGVVKRLGGCANRVQIRSEDRRVERDRTCDLLFGFHVAHPREFDGSRGAVHRGSKLHGGFLLRGGAAREALGLFGERAKCGNRLAWRVRRQECGVSSNRVLVTRRDRVELLLKLCLLGEFGVAAADASSEEERCRQGSCNARGKRAASVARERKEGGGRESRERETLLHRMKPALWRGMRTARRECVERWRRLGARSVSELGGMRLCVGALGWVRAPIELRLSRGEAATEPTGIAPDLSGGVAVESSARSAV